MSTTETAPLTDESQSFGDYVQQENAKERDDMPAASAVVLEPAAGPVLQDVPSEAPAASESPTSEPPAGEPPAEASSAREQPRAKDGTFKKVSNTGEWARNRTLTAQLRQAQADLEALRASQAATPAPFPAATSQPRPWEDPSDPEPTIDKLLDRPDPYAALAIEAAKWAVRDAQRQLALQQHEAARAEARTEVEARIATFADAHPDYREVVASIDDVQFPNAVLQALADDDDGPALVYYLASHPDEARRVAAMTPVAGVKEVGKLLPRVAAAPSGSAATAPVSRAKPPIKPVGSSPVTSSTTLDPETTEFSDWVPAQNAIDRKRRRNGV